MTSLIIIALIFFAIIAYLRLELSVLLIIVLLPTYLFRFNLLGIPGTVLEAMILISFIIWFYKTTGFKFLKWYKQKAERVAYPFYREIIAILIVAFISLAVASFSNSGLGILKAYFFEPIILFILILNTLKGRKGREKIIIALSLGALHVSILGIYQQLSGLFIFNPYWAQAGSRRVVSWFGYPNAIGLYLAPIALISLSYLHQLIKEKRSKQLLKKFILILSIILSILTIYFAKSEGALIALALAFVIYAFLSFKWAKLIIPIALIIFSLTIFYNPSLRGYALEKLTLQDLSGEIRKQQWKETMQTFKGPNFFLGNGLSAYPLAVAPYHQEGIFFNSDKIENFHSVLYGSEELRAKYWQPVEIYLYPHNIFLNFWTELGILGLITFAYLIVKFEVISLRLFLKNKDYLALGLFSAMLVILVHGLVDVPYFKNDLAALFFIILALLASLKLDNKLKEK